MGKLSEKDEKLLSEHIECVEYGSVRMEFKRGECTAISHENRKLTEAGEKIKASRSNNRGQYQS